MNLHECIRKLELKYYKNKKIELFAGGFFVAFLGSAVLFDLNNILSNTIFLLLIVGALLYMRKLIDQQNKILAAFYLLVWLCFWLLVAYQIFVVINMAMDGNQMYH